MPEQADNQKQPILFHRGELILNSAGVENAVHGWLSANAKQLKFSYLPPPELNPNNMSTIEPSKPFATAESISYADGSVVSKTILKKPTGNITLFAFDKGEGLAEHSSPHEALVQVLDGTVEITIGGEASTVQQGESIILPANIPHALKATERFKMMLVMIKT
jgi:quercetin dioxygenase-like cupin family protein